MEELVKTFHIDGKLIFAQVVNFAIVVGVLYKFAYAPLLKLMNERTEKIEKGLKDAEKATTELERAEEKREEHLKKAKIEAKEILAVAQKQADKNKKETVADAKEAAQKVVEQAKKQIAVEKEKMIVEVKTEVGQLVVAATEKMIDEKVDKEKDKEIISRVIKEIG